MRVEIEGFGRIEATEDNLNDLCFFLNLGLEKVDWIGGQETRERISNITNAIYGALEETGYYE